MYLISSRRAVLCLTVVMLLTAACGAYGSSAAPTPATSSQLSATAGPQSTGGATAGASVGVTVGPLAKVSIDALGLTMLAPTNWKAPVLLDDKARLILSPDGSTDTSATAGPFLYIIPDTTKYIASHLSYTFRPDISDPTQQLDLLMQAINIDAPAFDPTESYIGSQYPAAIKRGYARDNEMTFVLMDAGNNHWIYVGAQAPERLFKYYDDAVFGPVTNSITLK